jgi:hypothetical protein
MKGVIEGEILQIQEEGLSDYRKLELTPSITMLIYARIQILTEIKQLRNIRILLIFNFSTSGRLWEIATQSY